MKLHEVQNHISCPLDRRAGPLCQAMTIGVIVQQVNAKVEFDCNTKRITNHKVANELLNGVPPRKHWEQY